MKYEKSGRYFIHADYIDTKRTKILGDDPRAKDDFIEVIKVIEESPLNYCVTHGTCLGLVREAKLLPWDADADIAIMIKGNRSNTYDEIKNVFLEKKFLITKYDDKKTNLCVTRNGFIVDINFYKKYGPLYICRAHIEFIMIGKYFETVNRFNYESINLNIPNNVQQYLKILYGSKWNIPKKYNFRFGRKYYLYLQKLYYFIKYGILN